MLLEHGLLFRCYFNLLAPICDNMGEKPQVLVMLSNLTLPLEKIIDFCLRHPIKRLSLFGSALRDDFRPDSDVDILVEFDPSAGIDLFDMADMEIELSSIVGRKVDLRTPADLSRYFRQQVLETAYLLYGQE